MIDVTAQAQKKAARAKRKEEMLREQGRAPEGGTENPAPAEEKAQE